MYDPIGQDDLTVRRWARGTMIPEYRADDDPPAEAKARAVDVPRGTRLSLRAGEWATHLGQLGTVYLDIRTVQVGGEPDGLPGWMWVRAHTPECRWESVACARDWCVRVAVRVEALYDAVNR